MSVSFTVTSAFKWWVREHPERLALHYDGEETAYGELNAWASRVAAHLTASGMKIGDRVSIFGTNSLEYAVLMLGIMLAGGISAPVSFRSSVRELRRSLAALQPVFLFSDEDHDATAREALAEAGAGVPALRSLAEIRPLRRAPPPPGPLHDPHPDEPLFIIGTSGSTGDPKGVIYSQRSTMV